MNDIVNEKADLPAPYDRDLSKVLRNLNRSTPSGFRRTANDRFTASLLRAGMTLIRNELGPGAIRRSVVPGDDNSVERRALEFLSQRAVVTQVTRNEPPFNRGTMGALRERWASHSHYVADLLRFGLWVEQYGTDYTRMRAEREKQLMDRGHDFVEAIHLAAVRELDLLVNLPIFRLHLLAVATAEGDKVIREAIGQNYRSVVGEWESTYERAFTARGFRPRRPDSFAKLAQMLAAMAEGMAMRELGDASSPVRIDDTRTLLGEGAVWLLLGCLQREDDDDRSSPGERLRAMTEPPVAQVDGP